MREVTFSPARALESLLFLARSLEQPTIHEVLKLRYFADKIHLEKFGFMASGDNYCAMKFGPVASNTYNMLKAARGERGGWIHPALIAAVEGHLAVTDARHVRALRAPDLSLLAPSDIECLKEALAAYGNMPFKERTDLSHDAAWKRAWEAAESDNINAGEMALIDIANTLANAEEVVEHLRSS